MDDVIVESSLMERNALSAIDAGYAGTGNRVAQIKNVIVLMTYFLLSDH